MTSPKSWDQLCARARSWCVVSGVRSPRWYWRWS